jgi:hypothetical protein
MKGEGLWACYNVLQLTSGSNATVWASGLVKLILTGVQKVANELTYFLSKVNTARGHFTGSAEQR